MATISDLFVRGELFDGESGLKSGAQLEDLVTRAYPTASSQLVDQSTLETYSDATLTDDDGNAINRIRVKDGGITAAKIETGSALVSTGDVIMRAYATVPSGFLECDGSAVSRVTYATLFAALGTIFGEGDGATTFNLPDMRGMFPRGYDHGAGNDPDAATRTAQATGGNTGDNVGSVQDSAFRKHSHVGYCGYGGANRYDYLSVYGSDANLNQTHYNVTNTSSPAGNDNETRPKNVSLMFIIKT